ncbi:MAG TPA: alpha/beta fold hydrolase [Xanthomonadales bacterium]|nr:alpha/beta fold hydrolase [Xanthomonadales bacterium]
MKRLLRVVAIGIGVLALAGLFVYFVRPAWLLELEYARLAAPAGLEEQRIVVGDHEWTYYDGGAGPVVVLVHGFSGSKENWLDVARRLARDHRVVVPDLPGWGESQRRADADYGVAAQARRLHAFLGALGLDDVLLAGHSMGGHIAGLDAADQDPRVRALALVDSAGFDFAPNAFVKRLQAGETPFNFSDRAQFDAFMHELFAEPPWLPPRVKDALIDANVASHAFHERMLRVITAPDARFLLQSRLAEVRVPVVAIWCRGDRLLDVSSLDAISRALPDADIVKLGPCSHMPMMEQPDAVEQALRDFELGR